MNSAILHTICKRWRQILTTALLPLLYACTPITREGQPAPPGAGPPLVRERPCDIYLPKGEREGTTIQCGFVRVPWERYDPAGASTDLAFVILKATGDKPQADAIVHISDGPGAGATLRDVVPEMVKRYTSLRQDRDIILYDQRGMGHSEPFFACPYPDEAQAEALAAKLNSEPYANDVKYAFCQIGDAPFAQLRDPRFSPFVHAGYDTAHDCIFRALVAPLMMNIARSRLANQGIASPAFIQPDEVASWLVALQAQDYSGALWSIGLRMASATEATVEQALAARTIVRTWPLRGTLHIVAARDVRWLLALLTPRVIAQAAGRYRQLDLDETTFARSKAVFATALQGGKQLTREELQLLLEQANIATTGQRGYYLLMRSAQDGLICFGSRRGKQQTFALLDEWTPPGPILAREEALAELARRYFTSHGPATLSDLARWAGLTIADAKTGVELGGAHLYQETIAGQRYWFANAAPVQRDSTPSLYLLPGFDEYLLGYADRSAVLDTLDADKVHPSASGMFQPTIAIDGRIAGTWKRSLKKSAVAIEVAPFRPFTPAEHAAYSIAARRYGEFLELHVAR